MKTRLLIVLLIVALLAGYYLLSTGYLKQRRQHESLDYQIADATRSLAMMPRPPENPEQRLAAAQANLASIESVSPCRVDSTRVINAILELADSLGIKAIPLIIQPWSIKKVGEHDYNVLLLNVSITGSFSRLTEFTERLENSESPMFIIERLSVYRDVGQSVETEDSEVTVPVSASLDLAIYTRSPPNN